jgi:hypothetical protein
MTGEDYLITLAATFGAERAAKIAAVYPLSGSPSPSQAFSIALTLLVLYCPARRVMGSASKNVSRKKRTFHRHHYANAPSLGCECPKDTLADQAAWSHDIKLSISPSESRAAEYSALPDPKAVQAIARAHRWATALVNEEYASIEELAESAKLHPKVVRSELRFAFLGPNVLEAVLNGDGKLTLRNLRKVAALNWRAQQAELYEGCRPAS